MKEGIVRKYQIQMLADLTAEVFRMPKKRVRTLENYARLTKEAMAFGVADPALIYERSYLVGERLRQLPLTATEKDNLHSGRLPENLYVADATILPKAMGNPPILTIMALAKKIAYALRRNAR